MNGNMILKKGANDAIYRIDFIPKTLQTKHNFERHIDPVSLQKFTNFTQVGFNCKQCGRLTIRSALFSIVLIYACMRVG